MNRSINQVKVINKKAYLIGLLSIFLVFSVTDMQAQMFSVKSKKNELLDNDSNAEIRIGTTLSNFKYSGKSANTPNSAFFEFNNPLYFIEANLGSVKLHFDYGTGLGKDEYLNMVNFTLRFLSDINLYKSPILKVNIPVQIISDSFAISSQEVIESISTRYEQIGFTFGTGLETAFIFIPGTSFKLSQLFHYGFASRGFGGTNGSKSITESTAQFLTGRIWKNTRLTLNFAYNFQNYNLDDTIYDYKMKGLEFGLGFTF